MDKLTLKAIRVNLGLSLDEASTRIGVSKDTLSNYERGYTYPDVPIIKRIEDVYNISYDKINFLVENTDEIVKNEKGCDSWVLM